VALFLSNCVWEIAGMFHFHFCKKASLNKMFLSCQDGGFEEDQNNIFGRDNIIKIHISLLHLASGLNN